MDELPRDAKTFVKLAKQATPAPDPALRTRVRARVDATLALTPLDTKPAGSGFEQPLQRAAVRLSSAKIGWVSGVLLIGASALFWAARDGAVAHSPAHEPANAAELAPATDPGERADRVLADRHVGVGELRPMLDSELHDRDTLKRKDSLARHQLLHEMALLERAAQALFAGDLEVARATLRAHRQRFRRSQLRQERDGLDVLADCMERSGDARQHALAFIQNNPASVLATRIERACGLSDGS